MKTNLVLCVTLAAALSEPSAAQPTTLNRLSRAEQAAGWKLLFDGRTAGG